MITLKVSRKDYVPTIRRLKELKLPYQILSWTSGTPDEPIFHIEVEADNVEI